MRYSRTDSPYRNSWRRYKQDRAAVQQQLQEAVHLHELQAAEIAAVQLQLTEVWLSLRECRLLSCHAVLAGNVRFQQGHVQHMKVV